MIAGDRTAYRTVVLSARVEPSRRTIIVGKDPDQIGSLILAVSRAAIVVVVVAIIASLYPLLNDAVAA